MPLSVYFLIYDLRQRPLVSLIRVYFVSVVDDKSIPFMIYTQWNIKSYERDRAVIKICIWRTPYIQSMRYPYMQQYIELFFRKLKVLFSISSSLNDNSDISISRYYFIFKKRYWKDSVLTRPSHPIYSEYSVPSNFEEIIYEYQN